MIKKYYNTFFIVCAFVASLASQNDLQFNNIFQTDQLNRVDIQLDFEDWRYEMDATGTNIPSKIKINGSKSIEGKLARKGNSANNNTRARDKFPMKFNGPGSFNFKLNNNYLDYTMGAREFIGYKLHKEFTGIGSSVAVADVYVNKKFYGRYNVIEDLNKGFYKDQLGVVTDRIKSTATTTGRIQKKFNSNLMWLGEDLELYRGRYEVKEGAMKALVSLIDIINNKPEEAHDYIDIEQAIRFIVVENYLLNLDGIIGERFSHNYELVKRASDQKWQLVPWDLNLCLGAWYDQEPLDGAQQHNELADIIPTNGKENNGLIRLVTDHYRFLYHDQYVKLLEKYPAAILLGWANDHKKIIASSPEVDDKLYDKDTYVRAYTENLNLIDGFVPALNSVIQQRYDYLKSLDLDSKFRNRFVEVSEDGRLLQIETVSVPFQRVVVAYYNAAGEMKRLQATPYASKKFHFLCSLPDDAVSYYVYLDDKGVRFSYPYNGSLSPIKLN